MTGDQSAKTMITRYVVNFSGCAFSSLLPNHQVDVSPSSSDCDSLLLRGNQFPSSSSTHGQVWLIGTCHDTMGVHVEAHVSSQQPPDLRPGAWHLKTPRGFVITTKQNSVSFGVSLIKPRSLSNYGTAPIMQMIINKTCSHCPSLGGCGWCHCLTTLMVTSLNPCSDSVSVMFGWLFSGYIWIDSPLV